MKRFSEQFHTKATKVKLKKSESADLRDRIVSYMEYHPLPADMKTQAPKAKKTTVRQPIMTDAFASYQVPFAQLFKFGGVFAAIVLVVIPFVAERAVPGDTLYAVKVNFNEEVRSTLTLDPYEKVEWETVLLNRRIAEAKILKKEGRLTEEVEAATAAAVKQHADNAKAEIETLRESDADNAAIAEIELDANLALQAQALVQVETDETASSTNTGTDLIAVAIDQSLEKKPSVATSTLPALHKLVARVEQHTTRVRELETTLVGQVEADVMVDVTRRIEDLERIAAEAFALPEDASIEAQEMLVDVIARAQTLIVFMTELEVRETVQIETVVPVVLTDDEKNTNRSERLTKIDTYVRQLGATQIDDSELVDKLAVMTEQLVAARANLDTIETYEAFITEADAALALGRDAIILIEQSGIQVVTPVDPAVATSTDAVATSTATTTDEVVDEESEVPVTEEPAEPVATTTEPVVEEPVIEESIATSTEPVESNNTTATNTEPQATLDV